MRALSACCCCAAAFDYKSISVKAPRRIVTQDDIDAKFEEVDKPYALYPVDGPAEEGLCVLAEISLDAPGFSWKRDNYIVELLDDQAEPFAAVSTGICDAGVCAGQKITFSFPIDIDMRAALLPEFGDLEQGDDVRVPSRRAASRRTNNWTIERPTKRRRSSATACGRARSRMQKWSPSRSCRPRPKKSSGRTGARDENLAEDAVPAFLLENCDVRWVDA